MRWAQFAEACPRIAGVAQARITRDQLVIVGTLRRDGWPRVSPCEVDIAAGCLFLGMMWKSTKAMDLLRDPRLVVHTVQCDRDATEGDIKFYGRAIDTRDPSLRQAFREAIQARIDWAPDEPNYHLFSVDIERAAYVSFGDGQRVAVWDQRNGLREWQKPH